MKNKLVACFGIKYEPQWLVDQLIENLKSWVDDFAILDCTKRDELWIHEGEYRIKLLEKALKMEAKWVLIISPDERWEKSAGDRIRPHLETNDKKIFEVFLKELYHPNWYKIDGIWNEKIRRRIYNPSSDQIMVYQPIQCPSMPQNGDYAIERLDVNVYHLKMIEPENRTLRAKVFKKLDPDNKYQGVGYDYLDSEEGAKLQRIPEGREYEPKYKKYLFSVPEKYLETPCESEL